MVTNTIQCVNYRYHIKRRRMKNRVDNPLQRMQSKANSAFEHQRTGDYRIGVATGLQRH